MTPAHLTLPPPDDFRAAKDQFMELYGSTAVMNTYLKIAVLCLSVLCVGGIVSQHRRFEHVLSHKALVRLYESERVDSGARLVYVAQAPISAEFYSKGKAIKVRGAAALTAYVDDATADFIVVHGADLSTLPAEIRARLAPLGEFGEYRLLREASH